MCSFSKRSVLGGGRLGFNIIDRDAAPESQMDLTIAPEVGYTLNENWDVAAALRFETSNNINGTKDRKSTTFAIEPYARYTFAETGIAKFFVDGYFNYGKTTEKFPVGADVKTDVFGIGIRPGVKVALSDDVCIVSTLGNLGYKNIKDVRNEFGFNVDNAINFGIYFNF